MRESREMDSLRGFSFKGSYDDGTPMDLGRHDQPIAIKIGDGEPVTYWAKADGVDPDTGSTRYKLLPMERG